MKKVLLALALALGLGVNAQSVKLKMERNGYESVVLNIPEKSSAEIYNKSIDWISKTYNSPERVTQGTVLNKSIVVIGVRESAYKGMGGVWVNVKYRIELKFKDEKLMLSYSIMSHGNNGSGTMVRWLKENPFKSDGTPRTSKSYVRTVSQLDEFINGLLLDYETYLNSDKEDTQDDW